MYRVSHPIHFLPYPSMTHALRGLGITFLLITGGATGAFGQASAYHPVKIVDEFTTRPDTGATFGFNGGFYNTPSIDGGTLVFRNGDYSTIWRTNVDGTGLLKIVDAKEAVPGGTGSFMYLTTSNNGGLPRINGGTVLFPGTSEDANMNGVVGLYTVPAMGGSLTRIVDTTMAVPGGDGTDFTSLGDYNAPTGSFTISNGKVAFQGRGGGTYGIYASGTNGSGLVALADSNHPGASDTSAKVYNFFTPVIVNGTVVFYGTTVFDPSTGYNALFTTSAAGGFDYATLIDSDHTLPGDSDTGFHTRFDVPPLANNATTLAFVANDTDATPDFGGVYTLPIAGGALTKIVDYTDALPGLDTTNGFAINGVALDTGAVAFAANDRPSSGSTHYGVYVRKADGTGPITRIIGSGDALDGGRVVGSVSLTTGGYSGGIIGVQMYFAFGYADASYSGLYAITPGAVVPAIVGATPASAMTDTAFSYQILGTNEPTSYGVQGLPPGFTVNTKTGLITGTPQGAGKVNLTLNAYNSAGKGSGTLALTITVAPPVITSATTATATEGSAFSYQITASGSPTSYGVQGLPAGITVNTKTGLITGTPQGAGKVTLTLNAYNAGGKGSGTLTLTIKAAAPVITSAATASATVGKAFSYQITASDQPTSFGVQGLPAGFSVDTKTGLITGTAKGAGKVNLTLNAYNAVGKGSAPLTLTVTE